MSSARKDKKRAPEKIRLDVVAYRQGRQWVLSSGGQLSTLPYWIETKAQVRDWVKRNAHEKSSSDVEYIAKVFFE